MGVTDANVVHSIANALPAGTNNIGDVDIASALPAGTNNIGDVDVLTLPALPTGTNTIGNVTTLTGATDDAAAAGAIFPLAGLYQTTGTVDEVDTGDVGRIRMTSRRGLIVSPDFSVPKGTDTSVGAALDLKVAVDSVQGTYNAAATTHFQWASSSQTRWFMVGMASLGFREAVVSVRNALGAAITVKLRPWLSGGSWPEDTVIYAATHANSTKITIAPYLGGVGVLNLEYCEALAMPMWFLVIEIIPQSVSGASGTLQLMIDRR